ncbi:pathway-specific regulatory protein [Penicillium argentinense]|uniref:Pathway-specific regulatory protein n=1 Tax=Penicillium argentinense TaxID=1131581 RepID=A0A9W9KM77_9EURO|nr:pathway-specific regulatory protein [Penicillium argentinense]KAJ5110686.1 pathway-specific regulatory protein [Penicillium argentinense]
MKQYKEPINAQAGSLNYRDLLRQLFEAVQLGDHNQERHLLDMIQDPDSLREVRVALDGMLASEGIYRLNDRIISQSRNVDSESKSDSAVTRSQPMVMNIQYLCSTVPFRVPAKPWTTVTDSDDLVSHLVSLYLTWAYPFYAFFCRETFVKHMKNGNMNSDFCSPLLVNALLANACFFSDYSEAYSLPGDVKRKGAHFLAEAESYLSSHQFQSRNDVRLSSLQAILLLYERYSLLGRDAYGYTMLNRAISMAESMGLVNNTGDIQLEASQVSDDMKRSLKRTAWGLFQIDTIVHMNFLKNSRIKSVNLSRISRDDTQHDELWIPYPLQAEPRWSYMSLYFDEACSLSYIARDASWEVMRTNKDDRAKRALYDRLCDWDRNLPTVFQSEKMPAPYILILRMRYHTLVINLCCHDLQGDISSVPIDTHTPYMGSSMKTAISSAREIASLVQTFKEQFGLEYSHHFAMYAINVSLFCLIIQDGFNILDQDFLNLTEAFSIIACRSQVGRNLFHTFKLAMRTSIKTGQGPVSGALPPALEELFEPRENTHEPDKWDEYAEGLAGVDGDGSFLKYLEINPVVPNLKDMLHWYEYLSIGEEAPWRRPSSQAAF